MTTTERTPTLYDYFAAAILANGIALMWDYVVSTIPMLVILSIPIYAAAGFIASYLVCKRTSKQHLSVGLKTALGSSLFSFFMIWSIATEINLGTVILLILCYLVGGILAAYITLRQHLKKTKTEVESTPSLKS